MVNNNSFKLFANNKIKKLAEKLSPPVIVAERLQSPENLGAILRLAGNISALKVWFVYDKFPDFKQFKINRRSSGAAEKVDWSYVKYEDLFKGLPEGYEMVAIETTSDATDIYKGKLPEKTVFFIGNERFGLSEKLLSQIKRRVYIPLIGPISSLNVSHALSIALFEWLRQQEYGRNSGSNS